MTTDSSVAGGINCSAAGGAESFVTQDIDCSVAGDAVTGSAEYFGGAFFAGSAYHHPSSLCALHHSCKWGNVVPMGISL